MKAFGDYAGDKPLEPLSIGRRATQSHDVQIDIAIAAFAILTFTRCVVNGLGQGSPCAPGYEGEGRIAAVGNVGLMGPLRLTPAKVHPLLIASSSRLNSVVPVFSQFRVLSSSSTRYD